MTEAPAAGRAGGFTRTLALAVAAGLLALLGLGFGASAVAAQTASPTDIAARIATTGRYLERSPTGDLTSAIDSANRRGVAFVWLNTADVAGDEAAAVAQALAGTGAPYTTVLVLTQRGLGARSSVRSDAQVQAAIAASFDSFRRGATADGVSQFVDTLGAAAPTAGSGTGSSTGSSASGGSSGGGVGSVVLPVAGVAVVGGAGFLTARVLRRRRQLRQRAAAELETDRAEIKTQLQDNADRVLTLGDRVIASGDAGLQSAYEQATTAYQEVSRSIDDAHTAAEIDALDDKIDQAEWQFEMIEARLDGKPVPPSPAEVKAREEADRAKAQAEAQAKANQPALRPDQSVFGPQGPGSGGQANPGYPPLPGGRMGGGMGGMGGLGGVLGTILMGGGGLPGGYGGGYSRRSNRRNGGYGGGGGFPGSGGGGGGGNMDFPQGGGGQGNQDF